MRITASQIEHWVETNEKESQFYLPLLIRKLILETSTVINLNFPVGDETYRPGLDGIVEASVENAWVPIGKSEWEIGCNNNPQAKADADFNKRKAKLDSCFIFITPRVWLKKDSWRESVNKNSSWKEIRVYDSNDLETWLDTAPVTTVWFGELLEISGYGVVTIDEYWEQWRSQTTHPITEEAFTLGRESLTQALLKYIDNNTSTVHIKADSQEEAVAFACSQLLNHDLSYNSICIIDNIGWQFTNKNKQIKVVIATTSEIAKQPKLKAGQILIVPIDSSSYIKPEDCVVHLKRATSEKYEEALQLIGESKPEAEKLSVHLGRSWTVYRRINAKNIAIREPKWVKDQDNSCLSALVLFGAWDTNNETDQNYLQSFCSYPYAELEKKLKSIVSLDDSPIIQIGNIWKDKAPMELLYLFIDRITKQELELFFTIVQDIFQKNDPALELPKEDRYAAAVYNKKREESPTLLDSICINLIKLRVYAESQSNYSLSSFMIQKIDSLITNLFRHADSARWLSLYSFLPALAEAAPNHFLYIIENDLNTNKEVSILFSESNNSTSLSSHCYYAPLLFALEILAWDNRYLSRVVNVCCQLIDFKSKDNFGNNPFKTLASFFRLFSSTSATLDERNVLISQIIKKHEVIAWKLVVHLVHELTAPSFVIINAKPCWRPCVNETSHMSDDEVNQYTNFLIDKLLSLAKNNGQRIADLFKVTIMSSLGSENEEAIKILLNDAKNLPDDELLIIRNNLRSYLYWHNSYNKSGELEDRYLADILSPYFELLSPKDIVKKQSWLFESTVISYPEGSRDSLGENIYQQQTIDQLTQAQVLKEIYSVKGLQGIDELINNCKNLSLLGSIINFSELPKNELYKWLVDYFVALDFPKVNDLIQGFFRINNDNYNELLNYVSTQITNPANFVYFLLNVPCQTGIKDFIESMPPINQNYYWQHIHYCKLQVYNNVEFKEYIISILRKYKRYNSILILLNYTYQDYPTELLLEILYGISEGCESDLEIREYDVVTIIKQLSTRPDITLEILANLEFRYFQLISHHYDTPHLLRLAQEQPEYYALFFSIAYKLDKEISNENSKLAWSVLYKLKITPGLKENNTIDRGYFDLWVNTVRELIRQKSTDELTLQLLDQKIGEILSDCPKNFDGSWPTEQICDFFEEHTAIEIRKGFLLGIINSRGVRSININDAGKLEETMAKKYRKLAQKWLITHPHTAELLENIAKHYDEDVIQAKSWADQLGEGLPL